VDRIAIVGKTGSGKTTLAKQVSERLHLEHIELDALSWLPDWVQRPTEEFNISVELRTRTSRWVTDGNYKSVRELLWKRADTVIWLDYPLWLVLWQISTRTLRRYITQESLWGTNVEQFRHVLGYDSLYSYAIRAHRSHRIDFPALFQQPEYQHLTVIRLETHRQAKVWINNLK
jgi:adenylate kinase family enzyme